VKAVILAGGKGTRIIEESKTRPKPMIKIGSMPILWHIMKIYSYHGINDFIICCGYKADIIKEYFSNIVLNNSDFTISTSDNKINIHKTWSEKWNITLVDTGQETMTGGRLLRVKDYLNNDDTFCFTYGDGLGDVNIKKLIDFHKKQKTIATLTSVYPTARYGALQIENNLVKNFSEKPRGDNTRINGGFFVLNNSVFDYLSDDSTIWEHEPLEKLAKNKQLSSYNHTGFWSPMDTLRDKLFLEKCWESKEKFWKIWL
jgi:glucose-1-phosphate cytidylyltransferase